MWSFAHHACTTRLWGWLCKDRVLIGASWGCLLMHSCSAPPPASHHAPLPRRMVTTVHVIILTWRSLWQPAQNNSAGTVTERRRERGERVNKSKRVKEKKNNNWNEKIKINTESWKEDSYTWRVHLKKQRTGISISEERGELCLMAGEYLVQWDSKKAE